jgi:AraC family transcriptional regulator
MTGLIPSLNAHQHLKGSMTACSWTAGWRSLLMRGYREPTSVEEFTTPATADHLVVLVTEGACEIESYSGSRWRRARYGVGDLGMTAPGHDATLRWRGDTTHSTLQLHLSAATIRRVRAELSDRELLNFEMPNRLAYVDPLIQHVMLGLREASSAGFPDLYAESAAELLAAHILVRHGGLRSPRPLKSRGEDACLCRVDAFMRENLATPLSLDSMAQRAGLSRFHLLRLFKQAYGETPFRRLTRLRMDEP